MIRKRIADRMVELGLSQTELGRLSGVPQPTIHRIMTGESQSPRQKNIDKISKALGVSPGWLWTGKSESVAAEDRQQLASNSPKKPTSKPGRARTKLEIRIVDEQGSKTFTSLEQEKPLAQAIQGFIDQYVAEIYEDDPELLEALRTYKVSEMKLLFVGPRKADTP
jgi:transcriptional regulator with XRE-family HTH domain